MANKQVDLIIDSNNRITGAAVVGAATVTVDNETSATGVGVLPGQSVHRVEIPEEFIGHPDFDRLVSPLLYFERGVAKIKAIKR
jgi:hypothetical protein